MIHTNKLYRRASNNDYEGRGTSDVRSLQRLPSGNKSRGRCAPYAPYKQRESSDREARRTQIPGVMDVRTNASVSWQLAMCLSVQRRMRMLIIHHTPRRGKIHRMPRSQGRLAAPRPRRTGRGGGRAYCPLPMVLYMAKILASTHDVGMVGVGPAS